MSRLAGASAREVMVKRRGRALPVLQNKPVKLRTNLERRTTLSLPRPGLQRDSGSRVVKVILSLYSSFSEALTLTFSLASLHRNTVLALRSKVKVIGLTADMRPEPRWQWENDPSISMSAWVYAVEEAHHADRT